MKKTMYPVITLSSCAENNFALLDTLCTDPLIKNALRERIEKFTELGRVFPEDPKDFYVVPIQDYFEAQQKFGLKLPECAALYLPSINLHLEEILSVVERENRIAAIDDDFSKFINAQYILGADYTTGDANLYLYKRKDHLNKLSNDFQVLFDYKKL